MSFLRHFVGGGRNSDKPKIGARLKPFGFDSLTGLP